MEYRKKDNCKSEDICIDHQFRLKAGWLNVLYIDLFKLRGAFEIGLSDARVTQRDKP